MKVALAAESIVTEETHEFYLWILRSMVEIEPRFKLSNIQIIFADQKITPTILQDLGIEGSCTLRGDFFHLLNEVWPEQFHVSLYPQLRKFLSAMLLSNTVQEWDNSYSCAAELAQTNPRSLSALDAIYQNHTKYAGYYLRSIEGNLRMNGDVAAEQNHSGVVAYLGLGASFSIAEQITHLLNRQKNLDKIRRQKEDDQNIRATRYQSLYFLPQQKIDDSEAMGLLSGYGFKDLWTRTIKRSFYLQGEITEDGSFKVWPTSVQSSQTSDESSVVIEAEQRCPCERRISLQIQCEHEYVQDGQLDIQKYHHRWYHRQTFDRLFPYMATVFPTNQSSRWSDTEHTINDPADLQQANGSEITEDGDGAATFHVNNNEELAEAEDGGAFDFDMGMPDDGDKENFTSMLPPTNKRVTFSEIVARAGELARTCSNSQDLMRALLCNMNTMIVRVRDNKDIQIHFDGGLRDVREQSLQGVPRPAIFQAITNATGVKRKQSRREFNSRNKKSHRRNVACSQVSNSNDDQHLPPPRLLERSCLICRQKGHQVSSCERITRFGVPMLPKNNEKVRNRLSCNLSNVSRYALEKRPDTDSRMVFQELPALSEIKGLVLHRRYLVNSKLLEVNIPENICLECTIITELGSDHPNYTKQLFSIECMCAHIVRNKTNIILVQLDEVTAPDFLDLSQQTVMEHQENNSRPPFSQHSSGDMGCDQEIESRPPFSQQSFVENNSRPPFSQQSFGDMGCDQERESRPPFSQQSFVDMGSDI
jgi:hypothetical protein